VYTEHSELFSLAQGKNVRDKICTENCQASSSIKMNASLLKLLTTHMTKIR
jgi:hypothetical protein